MGFACVLQGLFSYMNDVHTWADQKSAWKVLDVLIASSLTSLQLFLIALNARGLTHFPERLAMAYGCVLAAALYTKRRSSVALMEAKNGDEFLFWHTIWHLILPVGAILLMLAMDWEIFEWPSSSK